MKKSVYNDYTKESEYFVDEQEVLKNEIKAVEKHKKFLVWVQEFSKKIVVIVFILYILATVFSLYLVYLSYRDGSLYGLDTLISEINQTFREVIGGYIIKAAIENAFKIGGNYFVGISNARLNALKSKLGKNIEGINNSSDDDEVVDDYDYQ